MDNRNLRKRAGERMNQFIENRAADEVPFSNVLEDLMTQNIEKHPDKMEVLKKMKGAVALNLQDIEAVVTLHFDGGKMTIDAGVVGKPALVIRTESGQVMDLNVLKIKWGLPYYFDKAGLKVMSHILAGRLKVQGMFFHPILLTRLTVIMSVM
jgi:hypothetical protein